MGRLSLSVHLTSLIIFFSSNGWAQEVTPTPVATPSWGDFGECDTLTTCFILGPQPTLWAWVSASNALESPNTFTALTIVTVSNTVSNTTRLSTIYNEEIPEGFTMPDTNSEGTRVATLTYTRFGTESTTVLTYPYFFVNWPEYYGWGGVLTTTQPGGGESAVECATGFPVTSPWLSELRTIEPSPPFPIVSNPQPTEAPRGIGGFSYNLTSDPYGLNFIFHSDYDSEWALFSQLGHEEGGLFPDQVPLHTCFADGIGPRLPQYGSTDWIIGTSSSIVYEGDEEESTTTTSPRTTRVTTTQGPESSTTDEPSDPPTPGTRPPEEPSTPPTLPEPSTTTSSDTAGETDNGSEGQQSGSTESPGETSSDDQSSGSDAASVDEPSSEPSLQPASAGGLRIPVGIMSCTVLLGVLSGMW